MTEERALASGFKPKAYLRFEDTGWSNSTFYIVICFSNTFLYSCFREYTYASQDPKDQLLLGYVVFILLQCLSRPCLVILSIAWISYIFACSPTYSTAKLLDRTGHKLNDFDVVEIHEAFAVGFKILLLTTFECNLKPWMSTIREYLAVVIRSFHLPWLDLKIFLVSAWLRTLKSGKNYKK